LAMLVVIQIVDGLADTQSRTERRGAYGGNGIRGAGGWVVPLAVGGCIASRRVQGIAAAQQACHVGRAGVRALALAVSAAVAKVGKRISALNHRAPVDAIRKTQARSKVQTMNGYPVVTGAALAVAIFRGSAGQVAGCGIWSVRSQEDIVVRGQRVRHHQVVTQSGIQRQLAGDLEVVLDVRAERVCVDGGGG